jgi:WD40 repeat protein
MPWGSLWLAVAVFAADPDPAEFRLVGTGKMWQRSVAFSPDGEWIAALRSENPTPGRGEALWYIDLWKVADVDAFSGSADDAPPPTATTEIQDCRFPSGAHWLCFSQAGEVVVMTDAGSADVAALRKEGPDIPPPAKAKRKGRARPNDTENGAGTIRFYDRESLTESRRWTYRNGGRHAQADLIEFPAGKTVIHFAGGGVRLLDEATGDEYARLQFDENRLKHPLSIWTGDARTLPGQRDDTCLIVAASTHRHAVWKLTADRKFTLLEEIDHHRLAMNCVISPTGNVLALAAAANKWERQPAIPALESQYLGTLEFRRVDALKKGQQLLGDGDVSVSRLAFSPDGKRLVSAGTELTTYELSAPKRDNGVLQTTPAKATEIIVWETATGRKVLRRSLARSYVFDVRFSPDGRRLLTLEAIDEPNNGLHIRLWDFERMLAAER